MCQGRKKGVCQEKDCEQCYDNSIAAHPKAAHWSAKNDLEPYQVSRSTDKKYWFDCDKKKKKCGHDFQVSGTNLFGKKWCPYCANQKLCDDEDCMVCFEKSIASHRKAKYWSEKNKKTARECFLGTDKKHFFDCRKCGKEFAIQGKHLADGSWCPCSY